MKKLLDELVSLKEHAAPKPAINHPKSHSGKPG